MPADFAPRWADQAFLRDIQYADDTQRLPDQERLVEAVTSRLDFGSDAVSASPPTPAG